MAKEKICPASKPVPMSGGVKDGGHSHITTPKKDTGGSYMGGTAGKEKIMK